MQQLTKIGKCHRSTLNNQSVRYYLRIDEQESPNVELMCTYSYFIAAWYGIFIALVCSESFVSSAAEAIHSMYFGFAVTDYYCICIGRNKTQA